jgi:hypothetical protein
VDQWVVDHQVDAQVAVDQWVVDHQWAVDFLGVQGDFPEGPEVFREVLEDFHAGREGREVHVVEDNQNKI